MSEEIRIIVIRRPYATRDPDPAEIIRLFSQAESLTMAGRMPVGLMSSGGNRRRKLKSWQVYAALSAVCTVAFVGAVGILLLQ